MVERVLAEFDIEKPDRLVSLGNAGGFSGSSIWQVSTPEATFCLKRWPVGVDKERIDWIQRICIFANANGCPQIATPIQSISGITIVSPNNCFWELSKWCDGKADYLAEPNQPKLGSAIDTLAKFHQATARIQFNFSTSKNLLNIDKEFQCWNEKLANIATKLEFENPYLSIDDWNVFSSSSPHVAQELRTKLQKFLSISLPVQPVIRDVRSEHFFFENDSVVGLIDFGAMQVDSVACDLARMLGEMTNDDALRIQQCLNQYSEIRPISNAECDVVFLFNRTSILIGIANWLSWLFVECRKFDSVVDVRHRIDQLFSRFKNLEMENF